MARRPCALQVSARHRPQGKGDGYVVLLQNAEGNAPSAILGAAKSKGALAT